MSIDKHINSNKHYNSAKKVIPSGFNNSYYKDEFPKYFNRAENSYLYDLDGNKYIDYSLSYGPSILGHSNVPLREALQKQICEMYTNQSSTLELQAAELIIDCVPSAEKVFFCLSGTDAVANAIKVARAYTQRNMIVRFKGNYHGWHDAILGGVVPSYESDDFNRPKKTQLSIDPYYNDLVMSFIAKHSLNDNFLLEWNDISPARRVVSPLF
jgi:glutamate-1-semialdehyde 2,1-aminomutase